MSDPTPQPEPSFPPGQPAFPQPPPGHWSEEDELTAAKADLEKYEKDEHLRYAVLEAKRRLTMAHPTSLDGYNMLLAKVREIVAEKQK